MTLAALTPPFAALLAQASALADTVVTVPVHSGFERWVHLISGVAQIVIALALIVIGALLLALALLARRLYRRLNEFLQQLHPEVRPILRQAEGAAENVKQITATARAKAESFGRLADDAQQRLTRASEEAERRVKELGAVLGVMQEEAEALFVQTASTARGVRASTEEFARLSAAEPAAAPAAAKIERPA